VGRGKDRSFTPELRQVKGWMTFLEVKVTKEREIAENLALGHRTRKGKFQKKEAVQVKVKTCHNHRGHFQYVRTMTNVIRLASLWGRDGMQAGVFLPHKRLHGEGKILTQVRPTFKFWRCKIHTQKRRGG
jgi:hypothetical protein